jgi:hypothetical protein
MEGATAPEQIRLEKPATPDNPPSKPARMNWVEMMNYFIGKGKVKRAAIFDLKGKCLSSSEKERSIPADEAVTICKYLGSEFQGLTQPHFGLFFGDIRYMCFRVTKNTIVGWTTTDFFVGHICQDVLIIALATIEMEPNFSCIGEVWTFANELRSRMEISAFIG